ncbi:MAG: hypothetical protein CVT68_07430 [Actinobacteria bacterium HGW-Actinobacteria-8]|nr:MAG: hypothetical protein CVT68_07430 [Actinobacteria bacterium HGW-Actinobacteria-8]
MALLTAEDVLNKAFSKTKYREGFDQDEVDDFLDEVANTIAALTAERDELQRRLALSPEDRAAVPAATQVPLSAAMPGAGTAQSPSESLLQAATDPNPPSATTMLAMAQKLHDEYVQAGEEARDRLIDEGKVKAEAIVEQAEKDAQGRLQDLETERADLERRIDDLRRFERDYRGHLRNYLENLLGDLEHNASKASAGPVGSSAEQPTPMPVPEPASEPEAAPVFGGTYAVPEAAPEVPWSPQMAFPEQSFPEQTVSPFGEAQPQSEDGPFGTAAPQAEPFPIAGDEGLVQAPGNDDEPGEKPDEAPRWNF